MDNLNHYQSSSNPDDTPSPSSAFDTSVLVNDMELTLINDNCENCENDNGILPDVVVEAKICDEEEEVSGQIQETYLSIAVQVFIPFLIAGFGMVCAGLVLDRYIQVQLQIIKYYGLKKNFNSSIGKYLKKSPS